MSDLPTADEITDGIARAIAKRDFEAVDGLLRLLAVVDRYCAQDVLDTIRLRTSLADGAR